MHGQLYGRPQVDNRKQPSSPSSWILQSPAMHHDLGRTNGGGLYRDRDSGASERYFNVLLGFALTDFFSIWVTVCPPARELLRVHWQRGTPTVSTWLHSNLNDIGILHIYFSLSRFVVSCLENVYVVEADGGGSLVSTLLPFSVLFVIWCFGLHRLEIPASPSFSSPCVVFVILLHRFCLWT